MNFLDFLIKNSKKYNTKTINYKLRKIERKVKIKLFPLFTRKKMILLENNFNEILSTPIPQKSQIPLDASIEINNTCNLKCLMCNTHLSKRPFGYMELDLFELVLKELTKIGIKSVGLHTVGEPLMYKDLDGLFNLIDKYNFDISLSTNGQLPHRLKNLLRSYSHLLTEIRFSIDGATPKVYENIRRGAEFKKLIQSLEIVHKFNQEKINYNLKVKIGSMINMANIYEILTFFKTYGKYVWPENIRFNLINSLSPDSSYFWETIPFPNLVRKTVPCILPFKSILFTYDGKITLCCRDYNGDLVVGDIKDGSIIRNLVRPLVDLDDLPYPDWSLFDKRHMWKPFVGKIYKGGSFEFSRGCLNNCSFCVAPSLRKAQGYPKPYLRRKSTKKMVEEINYMKKKYDFNMVSFGDTNFLLLMDEKELKEFESLWIKKINLPFTIQSEVKTITNSSAKILKKMGCVAISIGVESGSKEIREKIMCKFISDKSIFEAFNAASKYGIRATANYIVGVPFETEEQIMESIDFNLKLDPESIAVHHFTPFLGTNLYEISLENGFIKGFTEEGDVYESAMMNMPQISKERINELVQLFIDKFNEQKSKNKSERN